MRKGTTPEHTFTLPFDSSAISKARVIYAQHYEPVLKLNMDRLTIDGNTVKVKLTQAETLKFDSKHNVQIQLRILTEGGDALASDITEVTPDRLLENEVLA